MNAVVLKKHSWIFEALLSAVVAALISGATWLIASPVKIQAISERQDRIAVAVKENRSDIDDVRTQYLRDVGDLKKEIGEISGMVKFMARKDGYFREEK